MNRRGSRVRVLVREDGGKIDSRRRVGAGSDSAAMLGHRQMRYTASMRALPVSSFALVLTVVGFSSLVVIACGDDTPAGASTTTDGGGLDGATSTTPGIDGGAATNDGDAGDDAGGAMDFCATFPSLPSTRPTAQNTGVPAGTTLTPSGGMTITKDATVIDARDITGMIHVNANNVTIMNSKVHISGGPSDIAIRVKAGVNGTKILRSEIYSDSGAYVGIIADNTTVCGSYLHGWENAMTVGGGSMIQANYIDRLAGGQAGPHFDGIEVYGGGAPSRLWGNHIRLTDPQGEWLSDTGAINLTAWSGDIDDVEMNGNWLGGGSYTLYVDEQNGDQATNVKITNNRFYRGSASAGTHLIRDSSSVTVWRENAFEDNSEAISK